MTAAAMAAATTTAGRRKISGQLGAWVSGLCFLHCVGTAALAPILPGVLALVSGPTWLEPLLWLASVAATGASLRRAGTGSAALGVWLLAAAVGALGFAIEADRLVQVSLGANVALSLLVVARRWRRHRIASGPDDCRDCDQERSCE